MRDAKEFIAQELRRHGYVVVGDHPGLGRTMYRMAAEQLLQPLGRGVYLRPDERRPEVLACAATRVYPDAVISGRVAAALTFWPELTVSTVRLARETRMTPRGPLECEQRRIPSDLRMAKGDLMLTCPALTVLDLCDDLGGEPIDQALRVGRVTLEELWAALAKSPSRPGNAKRAQLLRESRDKPWSEGERKVHTLLREAKLAWWVANHPIMTLRGRFFGDITFRAARLVLEFEGDKYHNGPKLHADRVRQAALTEAGWLVIRLDWTMVVDDPKDTISLIGNLLKQRGSRLAEGFAELAREDEPDVA